jgi:NAD(P)-dependent dehydrogenase (short-subunit alcohol dehydrogenase family)
MPLNPPMAQWAGRTVWLLGASSGIGRATASALHAQGANVVVSARNGQALDDFVTRHPGARAVAVDVCDAKAVKLASLEILSHGDLHCAVYCAGHYTEMTATAMDLPDMLRHVQVNYAGALHMLDAVLPYFLARRNTGLPNDHIAHISLVASVAGYRGLPKSLAYGPTKAALINLAETLYLDLLDRGIGVSLVSPGFVDTPLTAQNRFKMPALITPEQAAQEILRGWARGDFEIHFPKRFTRWMKLLQLLPYRASFAATRRLTQE